MQRVHIVLTILLDKLKIESHVCKSIYTYRLTILQFLCSKLKLACKVVHNLTMPAVKITYFSYIFYEENIEFSNQEKKNKINIFNLSKKKERFTLKNQIQSCLRSCLGTSILIQMCIFGYETTNT
jgi:hypothetical protein